MSLKFDDSDDGAINDDVDPEEEVFDVEHYEEFEEPNEHINDGGEQAQTATNNDQHQQLSRREKNRINKLNCRIRKRDLIKRLQEEVNRLTKVFNELRAENEQLRREFAGCVDDVEQDRTDLGQNVLHNDANHQQIELLQRYHHAQRQVSHISQTYHQPTASVSQVPLYNHQSFCFIPTISAPPQNMALPLWSGMQQDVAANQSPNVPRNDTGNLDIGEVIRSLLDGEPNGSMFGPNKRSRFG